MNETARRRSQNTTSPFPLSIAYALLIGFACAIVLLLLTTAVVYAQADPNRFALGGALAVLYLSAAASGIAAARLTKVPLLSGLVTGAVWLVLILLLALLSNGSATGEFNPLASILAHAAIPVSSLIGGYLGKKHTKRTTSRHKKRRR